MKAQIVSFHCVLRDNVGKVISSTFNQDVITQREGNPDGDLLQGLARGLENLKKGEKRQIFIPAKEAYGFYEPKLVMEVPRKNLNDGAFLQVGEQVTSFASNGKPEVFRVIEASELTLVLDGNHPLAGQDLRFDIETIEARDATREEIAESRFTPPSREHLH